MTIELKDWLNSINQNKKNLYEEDPDAKYPAYIINRCMSGHLDTVLFANEMNMNYHISKRMQYDFYINSLRPRKRFSPWSKKESVDYLEDIKEYYGYSYTKALEVIRILPKSDLEKIRKLLHKGGT